MAKVNPTARTPVASSLCLERRREPWDPKQALYELVYRAGELTSSLYAGCTSSRKRVGAGTSFDGEEAWTIRRTKPSLPALMGPKVALGAFQGHALLFNSHVVEQLDTVIRERMKPSANWHLLFWTALHGTSLQHMLRSTAGVGPCVLLLRDRGGRTFGALCSELREPEARRHAYANSSKPFYGNGLCCLLALSEGSGGARSCTLRTFGWSGKGRQFISCPDGDSLVVGAGGKHASHVGLMLDGTLSRGSSGPCETFDNPPLTLASECPPGVSPLPRAGADAVEFEVVSLEVWALDEQACIDKLPGCKKHVCIRGDGSLGGASM